MASGPSKAVLQAKQEGNNAFGVLATSYHQSRSIYSGKLQSKTICVWTFVDVSFLLRKVWVATSQGQRTIAKKRLTKTVITKSPPYLIYCVFNLRETDWLGKHGPDFQLFLGQWSSYPLPQCPQTAKDTHLPHRSVLFWATSKS